MNHIYGILMAFDIIKFYESYKVPFATTGTKHTSHGWVNIRCPFCVKASNNYHLGVHISSGAVKCWKCGTHSLFSLIQRITGATSGRTYQIKDEFTTGTPLKSIQKDFKKEVRHAKECVFPAGTGVMQGQHIKYLQKRCFDHEKLSDIWGLKGTGPIGNYKHRIIAPIYLNGIMVSYQGRDITGKSKLKYKACKKENEIVEHQSIVYGMDLVKGNAAVLVEGITDAWRLGPGAICCFGTAYTTSQINMIIKHLDTVFVMFDGGEEDAENAAVSISNALSFAGCNVEILTLDSGDPGEMNQDDADHLMRELNLSH